MVLRSTTTFARLALFVVAVGVVAPAAIATDEATAGPEPAGVIEAAAPGGYLEPFLFYAVAAIVVISALGVCIAKNIVRMAVWLFGALGSVALLYFLLAANFIGAVQLIVYVGGTLILLVFGVMLTSRSPWVKFEPRRAELIAAAVVCVALLFSLCVVLGHAVWHSVEVAVPGAALAAIGRALLTTYLVPFEVAGVLLMIVMVGAAHLARQEK
jgi:NADH:ubiquinone oxidoreductase subunit 6 (subunit J)